jgi:hypothetical protein
MRLARLEWPTDAEIPRGPGLRYPADQVNERRRQQGGMPLVGHRPIYPGHQQRERQLVVGVLNIVPAGWKAVREAWDGNLGRLASPVPSVQLHQQHRRQFAFGDHLRPRLDRVPVAVTLSGALARCPPGRVVKRPADLDDRLHLQHGPLRLRRASRELVDLPLETATRP